MLKRSVRTMKFSILCNCLRQVSECSPILVFKEFHGNHVLIDKMVDVNNCDAIVTSWNVTDKKLPLKIKHFGKHYTLFKFHVHISHTF